MRNNVVNVAVMIAVMLVIGLSFSSCKKDHYTPKPRGYLRIDLQDKSYRTFDAAYPYTFEYPAYGELEFLEREGERYWMNLHFPQYNATIYLSYKQVDDNLAELIEDSHKMSYKHSVKADAINPLIFINEGAKVYGMFFELDGDAASPIQFYVTDSTRNFLRGSLYFYTSPNRDSLSPFISYFNEDIRHMVETMEWKK